jgi:tryptophan synthase beta chain
LKRLNYSRKPKAFCQRRKASHAIRAAIDEALEAKETGQKKTILFNLSGHGHFDLSSYNTYLTGQLSDYEYPEEAIKSIRDRLPQVPIQA